MSEKKRFFNNLWKWCYLIIGSAKDPKQDSMKFDGSDVNNWASLKSKEYLLSISRSLVIKLELLLLFYDKVFPLFLCLSATEVQNSKNNEGIQHS